MFEALLGICQKLATLDEQGQSRMVLGMPLLLTKNVQEDLESAAKALPAAEQKQVTPVLTLLRKMRVYYQEHRDKYPIGLGPIERIYDQQERGEITPAQAEVEAGKLPVASALGPLYIEALSGFDVDAAHRGNWRLATGLHKLLLTAVRALAGQAQVEQMLDGVELDWIEVVHSYVYAMPDGRVFRDGVATGEELIQRAIKAKDEDLLAQANHKMGTLYLDPYAARSSQDYEGQMRAWYGRLQDELGMEIASIPAEDLAMPKPLDALAKAEQYLRQAAKGPQGKRRGLSLKALAQAIQWQGILSKNLKKRKAEIVDVCRQALKELTIEESPQEWVAVQATLAAQEETVDSATVEKVLAVPWDTHFKKLGPLPTVDLVLQAAQLFQTAAPARVLTLMLETRPIFDAWAHDGSFESRWIALTAAVMRLSPRDKEKLDKKPLAEQYRKRKEQAAKENWDAKSLAAALFSLAAVSGKTNEEPLGLQLLDEAAAVAPVFTAPLKDLFDYHRALLWMGVGVNGVDSKDWAEGIRGYVESMHTCLRLKLYDKTMNLLRRIDDLAAREGKDVAVQVAVGLLPVALKLETALGEPAARMLRQIAKRAIAGLMGQVNVEVLSALYQIGKGMQFAAALSSGASFQWRPDAEAEQLLRRVSAAEQQLDQSGDAPEDGDDLVLDDEAMLSSYLAAGEAKQGDSPAERFYNLQRAFDTHVSAGLLNRAGESAHWWLPVDDIQASLDPRTVLVNFYLGATAEGSLAVHSLVITRDAVNGGTVQHPFPDSTVIMSKGKHELTSTPFAVTMADARREVRASPGPGRNVSPEGEDSLAAYVRGLFGHMVEYLEKLRAQGKDHLCIVPHGPLHFYPCHLLGEKGKTLADDWIVTYLPNLALLLAPRGSPSVSRYRPYVLTSMGLSFQKENPFHLPPLAASPVEASTIAGVFKTQPVLDQAATEKTLREALVSSRFVHLSTHGLHNVAAPSFQCLFLTPEGDSDGRLYAHELLQMDLRGLEVLTLSACETALGRFDERDNLRGLPASFLLAGVATIIGTLWPVELNVAEKFFTVFYEQVKGGLERRDAFAQAQREARKSFPTYSDWGAFYYIGMWR